MGAATSAENTFRAQISIAIAGAFTFILALAWNDAVQTWFNDVFPQERNSVMAKFIYAFIVLMVTVVVLFLLNQFIKPKGVELPFAT